ncbi:MAG: hypothetical protein K9H64_21780 [Bacteroidales bacterium]|nr:hypothetical protein [Bacteroidales bacterium]MCF8458628.1 hypothetical protein [Bacteroidales bacterium]
MNKIIPITPSTGGLVSPTSHVIGRDEEIELFWRILKKQGIALFAERRFGKSSILRKMAADGKKGFITIYKPVEGISSPENLASVLFDRIKEMDLIDEGTFKKLENFYNKATEVVDEFQGIKLKKLDNTWQKQLYYLFTKLTEKQKDKTIIILLDEFSIFLDKLSKDVASSVIGFFRNVTFEEGFKNIRFIYCGSIGIDLVLDKIKGAGHIIGDPLNHMYKHELLPFTDDNAKYFGHCLGLGCGLNLQDEQIDQICKRSNNIPYFIDIVFDKISKSKEITQEIVDNAFEEILDDTKGKESIKHFYDRIEDFYPNYKISVYILNFVSKSNTSVSESEIASNVLSNTTETDRIEINEEIERLKNDGYLLSTNRNNERIYDFKYSLIKSWWKRNKAY